VQVVSFRMFVKSTVELRSQRFLLGIRPKTEGNAK
jgi:hypothetical protein